jgi:hypothetical protein
MITMSLRVVVLLLVSCVSTVALGEKLRFAEKGKNGQQQETNGSVVLFQNGILTFRSPSNFKDKDGKPIVVDASFSATDYEVFLILNDEAIRTSVDNKGIIEMSYPSKTKDVDLQHVMAGSINPQLPQQGSLIGDQPVTRDLRTCKNKRGKDLLITKAGSIPGTVNEISSTGSNGYIVFVPEGAKASQKYRFNEVTTVVIGMCL